MIPRDFTFEITDHDLIMMDAATFKRFDFAFQVFRAELIRRGYTLHEFHDEASQSHKCHCFIDEPVVAWTQPSDPHSFTA